MSRKKSEPDIVTMNVMDLIPQYGKHKEELDKLKKQCDEENKTIKVCMAQEEKKELESGGYQVKYIIQNRETFNEEMLIDYLHQKREMTAFCYDIIKTKEYIDFDALEKAIYNGFFDANDLAEFDKAREIKQVETIRISKVKEKK